MSRAAAALLQSFDLSQSQEKHSEKPASHKLKETPDDEEVVLPRWQQKQQQEVLQQGSVADEKKSTSSNNSSSQGSSSDDASKGEPPPPQVQQWQSVISAIASSSSGSQGTKAEPAVHASNGNKEQFVQVVDASFLESTTKAKAVPLSSEQPKDALQGDQLSLSPSSLVIAPFKPDDGNGKGTEESPALIPGPTQPEMSEDMFRPIITQESLEQQNIPGIYSNFKLLYSTGGLMVSMLNSRLSGPGSSPGRGHCVQCIMFLGKIFIYMWFCLNG